MIVPLTNFPSIQQDFENLVSVRVTPTTNHQYRVFSFKLRFELSKVDLDERSRFFDIVSKT